MTELKSSDNLFAGIKAGTAAAPAPAVSAPAAPVVAAAPAPEPEIEVEEPAAPQVSQLDMLKSRARLMGVTFSNNISVEALKKKIDAKLAGEAESQEEAKDEPAVETQAAPAAPAKSLRQIQLQEQMKLVRLRITNLDPKKKDLPGEILTVANRFIGTVRKYVPYGEVTDNGWHVPHCIYTMLKDREFLNIRVRKGSNGREIVETTWAREFALEVLEPLTQVELARLAAAQAAGNNID